MLSSVEDLETSTLQDVTTSSSLCSKYRSVFKAVILEYQEKKPQVSEHRSLEEKYKISAPRELILSWVERTWQSIKHTYFCSQY